jgi:hypothetical protein
VCLLRHSKPKFYALLFSQLVCREIDAPGAVNSIPQTQQTDCAVTLVPSGYKRAQGSACEAADTADIKTSSNNPCDGQEVPCLREGHEVPLPYSQKQGTGPHPEPLQSIHILTMYL